MRSVQILYGLIVALTTLICAGCGPSRISEDEVNIDESVVLEGDKDDGGGSSIDE